MCRGKNECTELGTNPGSWDKYCPLRPPVWIDEEIDKFAKAVDQLIDGNREDCLMLIAAIRGNEFTEWYIEHGQMSGKHRNKLLGIPRPEQIPENMRDSLRSPKKYQNEVFARDNYHCNKWGQMKLYQTLPSQRCQAFAT